MYVCFVVDCTKTTMQIEYLRKVQLNNYNIYNGRVLYLVYYLQVHNEDSSLRTAALSSERIHLVF